jgi:hypothetical protein
MARERDLDGLEVCFIMDPRCWPWERSQGMKYPQPRPKSLKAVAAGLGLTIAAVIILAAAVQERPPYDPERTFPVETLKADLEVLWDVLEEGHGGFERYTPAGVLRKKFDEVRDGLTSPLTEFEFSTRLLPLVAGIKDGHTQLILSAAAAPWLDGRPIFFPFGLRFLKNKAYLFRNLSAEPQIKDGAELLAIDGRPVGGIVEGLLPLVPADAGIRTSRLRRLENTTTFGRLLALKFEIRESRRVRFRPVSGSEPMELTLPCITANDANRLLRERYPSAAERRPTYELAFRGAAAVLTVRQFGDDPDKARPRFPDFLKDAFRMIEEKKTAGLVIDLRGNGGGRDEYAKLLFAHVMDRPFLYYWALETKKDRYDLFRYTGETEKDAKELAQPLRKNARGWFDVLGHPNRGLQTPAEPGFRGRVAVLVDGGSFSATGETTSAFHYYKKAVFFGEECGSGYYGNTSGFMVMATLPGTGIRVRVPLVLYTMAVDGYPRDRGLVPDFPVEPTIDDLLAGRDPVLDRALAHLGER